MNISNKKRILVTGGAGYVGSILIRQLLKHGYKVVCVDNLRFGGLSLVDLQDNIDFELKKIDITNFKDLDDIFDLYDFYAVVHLAAIVGDPACKLQPELAIKTNRDASIHLLENAMQSSTRRFIFASTCSNYGKMNGDGYVDETSPLTPISLYAELKVEFEKKILYAQKREANFCPTVLRFATIYGISPRMRFDLTVNEFTKELTMGHELQVYGEQFWRPYCHVDDISQAILKVLQAQESSVSYEVFNVGDTSQNYTKKMLVDELLNQIPDGSVKYIHKEEDPRDYRVTFEKIEKELDFKITKKVPDGIHEIYTSLISGIIDDPDDSRYHNVPR